ncbi:MAG: DUF1570 domain-containing protein [Thermoguttaceae bacterium]|jgi:hypothetical protein|nr:DUF1570 domain-containing protein [Thermoguttaceae bacterium]
MPSVRLILILAVCACWPAAAARADVLQREAEAQFERYRSELKDLAAWCTEQGLPEQARHTLDVLGPTDPYKLFLPNLSRTVGPTGPPADASPEVAQWHRQLQQLQAKHATASFDLARRAVRVRPSLAYELALAAIRANPDHEGVRRVFGYQKYLGEWRTVYEVGQLRAGKVWDERFGWLPKGHLHRYEQGMRLRDGRWITAEEDSRQRADIRDGWDIETEHYLIRTNHSLEAGVQLGEKLERLYGIWQQLFIRFYASQADVVALFSGQAQRRQAAMPRHQVAFFRDRDDYNRSLRAAMPNIDVSIGVYMPSMRRAYFFAGPDYDDRTLYHEATHQLFQEARRTIASPGGRTNFWIVEGIALFMESLHQDGDYWALGGLDDARLHAARVRLMRDDFYIPLAEFTSFGMDDIQTHPQIATLYSQAAGLTHFLVFHEDGAYRDALVQYLSLVYSGRDAPRTLSELLEAGYPEIDQQYRQFVAETFQQDDTER